MLLYTPGLVVPYQLYNLLVLLYHLLLLAELHRDLLQIDFEVDKINKTDTKPSDMNKQENPKSNRSLI
jgi:hypothetical protein